MEATERPARLGLARVVGQVFRIYRARWGLLIGAGLVIFVPLSLVEVGDEFLQEPLRELDHEGLGIASIVAIVGTAALHGAGALLGEVLYAGVVTSAVLTVREGRETSLRDVARTLPYGRLIGADLLLGLVIVLGLLALVLPGLVFLAWFALIAPVIKVEGLGVTAAFRRSRELVRGNTWRVFALVFPVLVAQDAIANGVHSLLIETFGESFFGAWTAAIGANLLAAPFYALAVVVIFFELRQPTSEQAATP